MRRLKDKCIITFPTTMAAIAMEKAAMETGTPGRLIPTPTSITAGCGMCWCAQPDQEEICRKLLIEKNLSYESFYRI